MKLADAQRLYDAILGPDAPDYEAMAHLMEPQSDGRLGFTGPGAVVMHEACKMVMTAKRLGDDTPDEPVLPSNLT